jgi:hypothetical protein
MNCPYCNKSIGGYVELGSLEYSRVSKGCCPHCGRPMPDGYRVGFPDQRTQQPTYLSQEEYKEKTANSTLYGCMMTVGGLLAGISFVIGNAIVRPWPRYTVGILYILIVMFFAFLFYIAAKRQMGDYNIRTGQWEYNAASVEGKGWLIASLLADALMIYISMPKHPPVRRFQMICLAVCGLLLLLTILIRRKRGNAGK